MKRGGYLRHRRTEDTGVDALARLAEEIVAQSQAEIDALVAGDADAS